MHASQAAVVSVSAHGQVDLSDALVGRHVQGLMLEKQNIYTIDKYFGTYAVFKFKINPFYRPSLIKNQLYVQL